jgi:hypothetical protein
MSVLGGARKRPSASGMVHSRGCAEWPTACPSGMLVSSLILISRHRLTDAVQRLSAALADRYSIERELGAGGMATVYLAEDLKHHRQVSIKVLPPELAAVLGADRFVQEITTTAQLQHPHILPLFDFGPGRLLAVLRDALCRGEIVARPAHRGKATADRRRTADRDRGGVGSRRLRTEALSVRI